MIFYDCKGSNGKIILNHNILLFQIADEDKLDLIETTHDRENPIELFKLAVVGLCFSIRPLQKDKSFLR